MNASEAREKLALYVDGALSPEECAAVEEHLAASATLRDECDQWAALRRCACRAVMQEPVPEGLAGRVRASVRSAGRRGVRVLPWASLAAAALLAIFLVVPQFRLGPRTLVAPLNAVLVSVDDFRMIYDNCAVREHHGSEHPAETLARLTQKTGVSARLAADGYRMCGCCPCFPNHDLLASHTYYASPDEDQVVSLFALSAPAQLKDARCCAGCRGDSRRYVVGVQDDFRVMLCALPKGSFAVCGRVSEEELRRLAGDVSVTRGDEVATAALLHGRP